MVAGKRYSLNTISKELNVSKASVSLVLNGKARQNGISDELQERIMTFCKKINYRPNIHAQRMNQKQVKNIGILVDESVGSDEATPLAEYNICHVIGGISEAADEAGYRFSLQIYHHGMDDDKIFEWFETKEIAGLIYYGFDMPEKWRRVFKSEGYKVVGISICPDVDFPCINVDNYSASKQLTKHLVDRECRRFLYLGGSTECYPGMERYRGFQDALNEAGIEFSEDNFFQAYFSLEKAEKYLKDRIAAGKLQEDAIVCANDNMAIGAIRALEDAGITVGEEVSVVGGDNIKLGQLLKPNLTTFDFMPQQQGKSAFQLLTDIIDGKKSEQNVVLTPSLHFRQSG